MAGFFEHGNEPSDFINGGEIYRLLNDYRTPLLHGNRRE
jgi:hypothetical protein